MNSHQMLLYEMLNGPPFDYGTYTTEQFKHVVENGQFYRPGRKARTKKYRRGLGDVWENSQSLAFNFPILRYVEGYALTHPDTPCPVQHAWCVDGTGKVVDVTWGPKPGAAYFGIMYRTRLVKGNIVWRSMRGEAYGPVYVENFYSEAHQAVLDERSRIRRYWIPYRFYHCPDCGAVCDREDEEWRCTKCESDGPWIEIHPYR